MHIHPEQFAHQYCNIGRARKSERAISYIFFVLTKQDLDCSIDHSQIEMPGYNLENIEIEMEGGGLGIYLRNVTAYTNRTNLIPDNSEAICLEIKKPKMKPLLISKQYRPPNSKVHFFNDSETFLSKVDDDNKEIAGDFNCDLSKNNCNSNTNQLRDLIDVYQLQQLIDK